jgi:hypothetical protein
MSIKLVISLYLTRKEFGQNTARHGLKFER